MKCPHVGLLSYYHPATGKHSPEHPYSAGPGGKGPSGYTIRVGDWKGVVNHCASADAVPTDDDVFEVYDLRNDPFEQRDVAGGPLT